MAAKSKESAGGDEKMPVTASRVAPGGAVVGQRRHPRVPHSTEPTLQSSLHTTRM